MGKAHRLTLDVYAASKKFPREELFGLVSQMRQSAASVGMNIAEGCCRKADLEMGRFVQIALGLQANSNARSCLPMTSIIFKALKFQSLGSGVIELKRMLSTLLRNVKAES